jgi:hypothetical protein
MLMTLNILWSLFGLVRQSVAGLLDEADPAERAEIERILTDETERRGSRYHEVRHRSRLAGIPHCFAERVASGQPGDSAALDLPQRASHDGHDRLGRVEFSGGESPRCRFYQGAAGAVGSAAGQLAKLLVCQPLHFNRRS